jgi:hypothetical protein
MLQELLEKLGIKSFDELTSEEQKTYQEWGRVLAAPEVSMDDVRKLVAIESQRAHDELKKFDNSERRHTFYQALSHLADTLNIFLDTPSAQRDSLRAHLRTTFKVEI